MERDSTTKFIGLDVHSKTISVAIADEGRKGEVRHYGTIENTIEAIDKVIKKLTVTGTELKFIYEAGPCGFALYRYLTGNGFTCIVTSPAMIPRPKNVRIKNDRRDAITLARLYRAGELSGIYVPEPEDAITGMETPSLMSFTSSMSKPLLVPSLSIQLSNISPASSFSHT